MNENLVVCVAVLAFIDVALLVFLLLASMEKKYLADRNHNLAKWRDEDRLAADEANIRISKLNQMVRILAHNNSLPDPTDNDDE